jgi:hypothetical protein
MHFEVLLSRAARFYFRVSGSRLQTLAGCEMRSLLQRSNLLSTTTEHSRCRFAAIRVARRARSGRPQRIGQMTAFHFSRRAEADLL